MMRYLIAVLLCLATGMGAFAQGTVRGTVSDASGETIVGAGVKVKEKPSVTATTDLDGNYSLKLPDGDEVTIMVVYISMKPEERKVRVTNDQVVVENFTLSSESAVLKDVVVERRA